MHRVIDSRTGRLIPSEIDDAYSPRYASVVPLNRYYVGEVIIAVSRSIADAQL
jgi:hypothetical protein